MRYIALLYGEPDARPVPGRAVRPLRWREDAVAGYRDALALEPAGAVRRHITGQIAALGAAPAPIKES